MKGHHTTRNAARGGAIPFFFNGFAVAGKILLHSLFRQILNLTLS